MFAKDIAESDFIALSRDTNALDTAKQMNERKHGFAIVVSRDGNAEGIVTEWDYLSKIVAEGRDPSKVRLEEIMTRDLVSVKASDGIDFVAKLMAEKGIRRVLVFDGSKILGIITAKTILSRLEEYINKVSAQIARFQTPQQ